MNNNVNTTDKYEEIQNVNFDEMERILTADLEENIKEIEYLKDKQDIIRNPDRLGEAVKTVIIEQIQNQFGLSYGEKFIQENNGLHLDLRNSAHIQTTDNFKNGKIATHNTHIDYQERYDQWQDNFQKDENGNVIYKFDRIDNENKPQLVKGYRKPYDNGREKGNASCHMDETVSVAEQVRDPAANAHLSLKERVEFDQSDVNLHPMDSSANESKGDHKAENWLKSERNGQ
ncbi:MAG: cation diffusion facilitator family transporter, partial [Spirochaetia bacterium]|nr:cation diffusion facilitator family transporter [Spirochaetia bacterium]